MYRVASMELFGNYYDKETLLLTIYPQYGSLI